MTEVLERQIGKRIVCVHSEGEKTHSVVGVVELVDKDVLVLITDFGVRNILPISQILKVKIAGGEINE